MLKFLPFNENISNIQVYFYKDACLLYWRRKKKSTIMAHVYLMKYLFSSLYCVTSLTSFVLFCAPSTGSLKPMTFFLKAFNEHLTFSCCLLINFLKLCYKKLFLSCCKNAQKKQVLLNLWWKGKIILEILLM